MPREKRVLVDVSAKIHRKFKVEAAKNGKTMSGLLCAYMEKYVGDGNPGDGLEKKTNNPGDDSRSPEEILVDKIIETRKAQEALKNPEKEPVDESLEVHVVEKPDEIRTTKKPVKEPEKELEKELEKEPVKEPAAEENPGPEKESNDELEKRKKNWWDWIPFPIGLERRKKK